MIPPLLAQLGVSAAIVAAAPAERPARETAHGQLRSAGERQPVQGARIFATSRKGAAWTREAISDEHGRFTLRDLPSRDFVLTIVAAGHQRFEQPTTSAYWSRRKPPTIYLQPLDAGYRTTVHQERAPRPSPVSARLSPEEITNLPGSQGDPLRALQNLPGVARVPAGLGLLILRGAAPNQSQAFFGEHPLPRAFHIPGLASVVQTGVLQGIEYVPGNFSAHYGNATGGIVHLTPRVGRRDGLHGHAKLDLISVGALMEGPFGKGGSFLIAAQRGYLDLALQALPDDVGIASIFRPRYHDYQFILDHPAGRGATITARLLGADDRLSIAPGRDDVLDLRAGFHRVDLAYRKRLGAWDLLVAPALRFDRTADRWSDRRRGDIVGLLRVEAGVRPLRPLHLTFGLDTQLDRYIAYFSVFQEPADWVDTSSRGLLTTTGLYASSQLDLGRFAIVAGARLNAFTARDNHQLAFDPRLLLRYTPHPRVRVQLAAGLYSQPSLRLAVQGANLIWAPSSAIPTTSFLFDDVVLPGAARYLDAQLNFEPDGRVAAARANQYSANLHLDLTDTLDLDATLFYRRVRDNLPPDPAAPIAVATGSETTGVELMLRHDLTARLYGWLAYTWMRSTARVTGPDSLQVTPADFDQRHNLVMLVGYKLPRRWSIAARFRVVTGLPYTPFVGAIESVYGATWPLVGGINSARMPVFHQLDLRLDRTWVLSRAVVGAYLDVQNIYNRQNAEGVLYNRDYSATRAVVGLPILPVLGLKVSY